MPEIAVISGTLVVGGAEHVLAEYVAASARKKDFAILHSDVAEVAEFYGRLGLLHSSCDFLNPQGADKKGGLFAILRKLASLLKAFVVLPGKFKSLGCDTVLGNNTGDAAYAACAAAAGRSFFLRVHDVLEGPSLSLLALKLSDRFIERYIAVSGAVKNALAAAGISREKIQVVYNGLGGRPAPARKKITGNIVIGFAGNLERNKDPLGFVGFVRACSERGIRCCGIMACPNITDRRLYEKVRDELKKSGSMIKYRGRIKREKMASFYRSIDFLMLPSFREALPTVAIEAMKYGVPVIARNAYGTPEIVRDGRNGLLYDENGLDKLIRRLAAIDSRKYAAMSRNCVKDFNAKFTAGKCAAAMDRILFGRVKKT